MSAQAAVYVYDEPGENPHSAMYRAGAGMVFQAVLPL